MKFLMRVLVVLQCGVILFFSSCSTKKEIFVEPQKDLKGTWRISKVTRNATDITTYIDSLGFRLTLSDGDNYVLAGNNIPFLVNKSGTWTVDDPLYPYKLSFNPTDSTRTFTGDLNTPVSKGLRNLEITFSPGCRANTYVYTFEKLYR
jgi:hypothetical protein